MRKWCKCGKPVLRADRMTCGDQACVSAANIASKMALYHGWPEVTGEMTADFSKHNLRFKRQVAKLSGMPLNHTTGGIGSRWMAS